LILQQCAAGSYGNVPENLNMTSFINETFA